MWQEIRKNRIRSAIIIAALALVLVTLGCVAGLAIVPEFGAPIGIAAAVVVWAFLSVGAFYRGDDVLLGFSGARAITKGDAPRLFNVVEEMQIAAGMKAAPRVYIIDSPSPNAFAVGRGPHRSAVAVTRGLLAGLKRDELQGVVAHEISHIVYRDVLFMTLAGVLVGSIALVADGFLRHLRVARWRRAGRGAGQAQAVFVGLAILCAILAPVAGHLLYFACSRRREFLADASAARLTRYPEGLASALEKIAGSPAGQLNANRAAAPLFIVNPLALRGADSLFSTHPPTRERVRILRGMAGASFRDYQAACARVRGKGTLPASSLATAELVRLREPSREPEGEDPVAQVREARDIIRRLDQFILVACPCGLRIKIPPTFRRDAIACPRCNRETRVPAAQGSPAGAFTYTRKGDAWESFRCPCGHVIQLSPAFAAAAVGCPGCSRSIMVEPGKRAG